MASVKGGHKLKQALAALAAKLSDPGTLRVGLLEGSTAPNGDSLPLRGAMNEYGHGTTPPRPAVRNMVAAKSPEWPGGIAHQLKLTNYDTKLTLERTGEAIKGQWQEAYLDLWSPALSPITIAKKGFDKPLIEHGDMINAVSWEVSTKTISTSPAQSGSSGFAAAARAAKP